MLDELRPTSGHAGDERKSVCGQIADCGSLARRLLAWDDPPMGTRANSHAGMDLRVGDAERDACLTALIDHHLHGRLSVEELDRRQRAALAAVTTADLTELLLDLPNQQRPVVRKPRASELLPHSPRLERARGAAHLLPPVVLLTGAFIAQGGDTGDWWHLNDSVSSGLIMASFGYATHWVVSKLRR